MAPLTVRPAVPADFPEVYPMLVDMGLVESAEALAVRFPTFCADPNFAFLVAVEDDRLLGYALVQDYGPHLRSGELHRTAKLHDLYTTAAARRQGVARILLKAVENWGRNRPLRYVFWYANAKEATPVYERIGYQPIESGQEGFNFFEIDFGELNTRVPHPLRGS